MEQACVDYIGNLRTMRAGAGNWGEKQGERRSYSACNSARGVKEANEGVAQEVGNDTQYERNPISSFFVMAVLKRPFFQPVGRSSMRRIYPLLPAPSRSPMPLELANANLENVE